MAIAFDTATTYTHGSASSHSFSHTVTGSDPTLVLNASLQGSVTITGITYNSVSMTDAGNSILAYRMSQWYLGGAATGANTVALTYSGADVGDGAALSLTGTDTGDPLGATASLDSTSNVTSQSLSITTDTDNSWTVDFAWINDSAITNLAADSGQTSRHTLETNGIEEAGSTEPVATAGSSATGWSWTTSARILQGAIEIHAAAAVAATITPTPTLLTMQVG